MIQQNFFQVNGLIKQARWYSWDVITPQVNFGAWGQTIKRPRFNDCDYVCWDMQLFQSAQSTKHPSCNLSHLVVMEIKFSELGQVGEKSFRQGRDFVVSQNQHLQRVHSSKAPGCIKEIELTLNQRVLHWFRWFRGPTGISVISLSVKLTSSASSGMSFGTEVSPLLLRSKVKPSQILTRNCKKKAPWCKDGTGGKWLSNVWVRVCSAELSCELLSTYPVALTVILCRINLYLEVALSGSSSGMIWLFSYSMGMPRTH